MANVVRSATSSMQGRLVVPALCLGSFVSTLNFAAPAPFFPAMSRDLGVSVALLGQIPAAMMILSAILALVVGSVADRYGSRRFIVIGLLAVALAFVDYGLTPVFWLLFIASIAGSIGEATVPGLSMAVAGSLGSEVESRRAMGWTTVGAMASAPIIGVPLLAFIGDLAGWRAAFIVAGVATAGVALMVAIWLPDDAQTSHEPLRWSAIPDAYRPLLHDRGMRYLFGCTLTRTLCWFGLLTYFGALLEDEFALTTGEIGLIYMLGGIGYFAGSLITGGPLAQVPARWLVAGSNIAMALILVPVFMSVFSIQTTVVFWVMAALVSSLGWVALANLLTSETSAGTGTTMVLNISLFNVGAAVGAALGGFLLATSGFDAVAIGLPLFGLVSAALVWALRTGAADAEVIAAG